MASCQNFIVTPTGGGSLTGMLAVFDTFRIDASPDSVAFAITGRVAAKRIRIGRRNPWNTLDWTNLYAPFTAQWEENGEKFFPNWLHANYGRDPQGKITIVPDPGTVTYDWFSFNGSEPIVVLDSGDNCLHWDILEWTDEP